MKTILKSFFSVAFILCFSYTRAQPKYEFRAAWIATVDNIDWPSKGNYNSDNQKAEFIRLLDMLVRNGMNAVIAQIRPATDAFYPSPYEPWSEWLTGKQGSPPNPYYDPLQFMIEETHKRGMEFHAWCNPYRAVYMLGKSSIASTHITRLHPEWFLNYGDKKYFDPGNKEAQQFVVKVIRDIVSRYDVDAIHFDDYFYPYRIPGKEFPDDSSYLKYGNGLSKDDWRRSNVDSIIVMLSKSIKEEKPYCRFGISPFGVWRNKDKDPDGSDTQAGQTNYDDLYANILLWLKNGWIDYVVPQLYWEIGHPRADYSVLVNWWSKHTYGRHCYIGLGIYKANTNATWRDKTLLPRQIELLRQYTQIQGAVYFSTTSFINNPNGWCDSLQRNYYKQPALVPAMSWIDSLRPTSPVVRSLTALNGSSYELTISKSDIMKEQIISVKVYLSTDTVPYYVNFHTAKLIEEKSGCDPCNFTVNFPEDKQYAHIFVTAVDKNNQESISYPDWPISLYFEQMGKVWIAK